MGLHPGRAIPKALKMVLVAPLLTLALKGYSEVAFIEPLTHIMVIFVVLGR